MDITMSTEHLTASSVKDLSTRFIVKRVSQQKKCFTDLMCLSSIYKMLGHVSTRTSTQWQTASVPANDTKFR